MSNELYHWGIKGMKWGVRRYQNKDGTLTPAGKMRYDDSDSETTKKAKRDYNELSDQDFLRKYSTSKSTYAKRVAKYGDPYMNSPLAKLGKKLNALNEKRLRNANKAIQKDIDSFKGHENGIRAKNGKMLLSGDEVRDITNALKAEQSKNKTKIKSTYSQTKDRIVKEIADYEKKTGKDFAKKFFENYDDIEMWDLYSPEELNFWD